MPNRTKEVVAEICTLSGMYSTPYRMELMVSCGGLTGRMVVVLEARRAGSDMLAHVPFAHKAPAGARMENCT